MGELKGGRLLSVRELVSILNIPIDTVYQWNSTGYGPKRYRVGRHVRYRMSDVDKWLEDRVVQETRFPHEP